MSSRWLKWFSDDDSSDAESIALALGRARECLDVAGTPWFKRYLESLNEESMKPGKIGDHADMIASTSRANTFREMRMRLLDEVARAEAFIQASKER